MSTHFIGLGGWGFWAGGWGFWPGRVVGGVWGVLACGGLPFPGNGCPVPDVDSVCLLCVDLCLGCCFYFRPPPWNVFVHGLCFSNGELNGLPWTSWLHAMLGMGGGDVSGLATDSPCGVWGRGWTTCLLRDRPLFGSHFGMGVGVSVWSEISYIYHFFLPQFAVSCKELFISFVLNCSFHMPGTLCTHIPYT